MKWVWNDGGMQYYVTVSQLQIVLFVSFRTDCFTLSLKSWCLIESKFTS